MSEPMVDLTKTPEPRVKTISARSPTPLLPKEQIESRVRVFFRREMEPCPWRLESSAWGGMSEYAIYWVIHFHRKMGVYAQFARDHVWKQMRQADAERRRVGILGLGELGGDGRRAGRQALHAHLR